MKTLSTLLFFAVLATASCKKEENSGGTPASTKSTWTLAGTTYTVNNFTRANDTYSAYDKDGNGIGFSFAPYPTSGGSFTVINDTATLGPQQVKVFAFGSQSGSTYFSTGSENKSATVSFEGNRIKIVLPEVSVQKGSDIQKVSANLDKL